MKATKVLLILCLLFIKITDSISQINTNDSIAITQIKESIYTNLNETFAWEGASIKEWPSLTIENNRIVKINFEGFYLESSSLDIIEELNEVRQITFQNIAFYSFFPTTIENLEKLENLKIIECSISSPISRSSKLSSLKYLKINSFDVLNATFSSVFSELNQLDSLFLYRDKFETSLFNSLKEIPNLKHLSIEHRWVESLFSSEISKLEQLTSLHITKSKFTNSIPKEIGNLSNLTSLIITECNLQGEIPTEVEELSILEELNLSSNQLTGSIPNWIKQLPKLTSLSLYNNQLSGNITLEHNHFPQLEIFILSTNQFDGNLNFLQSIPNIVHLSLTKNSFSGEIPQIFHSFSNLISLYLGQNDLTGPITEDLFNAPSLKYLDLSHNSLSGKVPSNITQTKFLSFLNLNNNNFSGEFPPMIDNYIILDISHNQFQGAFIIKNSGVRFKFNISHNNFTALQLTPIPTSIFSLESSNFSYNFIDFSDLKDFKLPLSFRYDTNQKHFHLPEDLRFHLGQPLEILLPKNDSIDLQFEESSYQWYKDSIAIPGAINSSFNIASFKAENEGYYYCVIKSLTRPFAFLITTSTFVSPFLSTPTNNFQQLNLFPNPCFEKLTLSNLTHQHKSIRIINSIGKEVYSKTLSGEKSIQIQTEELNSGIYFMQVIEYKTIKTIKFIVSN